ncbi:hypothetical protein AOLI_G00300120 [Acnodon oligacanthus]
MARTRTWHSNCTEQYKKTGMTEVSATGGNTEVTEPSATGRKSDWAFSNKQDGRTCWVLGHRPEDRLATEGRLASSSTFLHPKENLNLLGLDPCPAWIVKSSPEGFPASPSGRQETRVGYSL